MAVEWNPARGEPVIADRALYLDKDGGKLVEEGDSSAATQLAGKGAPISAEDAKRLSLVVGKDGKVSQDFVVGVGDLKSQLADAESAYAEVEAEVKAYREENAVKDVPNTLELKRVGLERDVEQARLALAQAIKAAKGKDPFKGESQATSVKPDLDQPKKKSKGKK